MWLGLFMSSRLLKMQVTMGLWERYREKEGLYFWNLEHMKVDHDKKC